MTLFGCLSRFLLLCVSEWERERERVWVSERKRRKILTHDLLIMRHVHLPLCYRILTNWISEIFFIRCCICFLHQVSKIVSVICCSSVCFCNQRILFFAKKRDSSFWGFFSRETNLYSRLSDIMSTWINTRSRVWIPGHGIKTSLQGSPSNYIFAFIEEWSIS